MRQSVNMITATFVNKTFDEIVQMNTNEYTRQMKRQVEYRKYVNMALNEKLLQNSNASRKNLIQNQNYKRNICSRRVTYSENINFFCMKEFTVIKSLVQSYTAQVNKTSLESKGERIIYRCVIEKKIHITFIL